MRSSCAIIGITSVAAPDPGYYVRRTEYGMNCISRTAILCSFCLFAACGVPASEISASNDGSQYNLEFVLRPEPATGLIAVTLILRQSNGQLREIAFPNTRISEVTGDGELRSDDEQTVWRPERSGGAIHWQVEIAHRRNQNGYDALLDPNWGILRAEDVIPRAKSRALKGTKSKTRLRFELPKNWSAVTEYPLQDDAFIVEKASRNYDEPSGWMAIGELGVRRETIAGTRVAVAAPTGHSTRRMDMLALLNWSLPEVIQVTQNTLPRLTIISAMDPMWRGGLSAPASIYIHADRPLISENATSTLLHEVMHVALRLDVAPDSDWITEGLAEFYSLELLKRSGAISAHRHRIAMKSQRSRAQRAQRLCGGRASGTITSLAVTVFEQIDAHIKTTTNGDASLDSIVPQLIAAEDPLDANAIRELVVQLTGQTPDVLHSKSLPGCSTL